MTDMEIVIQHFQDAIEASGNNNTWRFVRLDIIEKAISLLKEQPERKHGHWIPIKEPTGVEAFGVKEMAVQSVRCSACNTKEDVSFSVYEYCPRCGAIMDGEVKHED